MVDITKLFINMFTHESTPSNSITDIAFKNKREKSTKSNTHCLKSM